MVKKWKATEEMWCEHCKEAVMPDIVQEYELHSEVDNRIYEPITLMICPHCEHEVYMEPERCGMCGKAIDPSEELCDDCRRLIDGALMDLVRKFGWTNTQIGVGIWAERVRDE